MDNFSVGEYIIYQNGDKYELGRIKSLREDGAFVAYHEGETGAKTPYSTMHKLINGHCIKETSLGGDYFRQAERPYDHIWDMYLDEFDDWIPDACKKCPNHPKNGGSGVCHCTLGTPKIQ